MHRILCFIFLPTFGCFNANPTVETREQSQDGALDLPTVDLSQDQIWTSDLTVQDVKPDRGDASYDGPRYCVSTQEENNPISIDYNCENSVPFISASRRFDGLGFGLGIEQMGDELSFNSQSDNDVSVLEIGFGPEFTIKSGTTYPGDPISLDAEPENTFVVFYTNPDGFSFSDLFADYTFSATEIVFDSNRFNSRIAYWLVSSSNHLQVTHEKLVLNNSVSTISPAEPFPVDDGFTLISIRTDTNSADQGLVSCDFATSVCTRFSTNDSTTISTQAIRMTGISTAPVFVTLPDGESTSNIGPSTVIPSMIGLDSFSACDADNGEMASCAVQFSFSMNETLAKRASTESNVNLSGYRFTLPLVQ